MPYHIKRTSILGDVGDVYYTGGRPGQIIMLIEKYMMTIHHQFLQIQMERTVDLQVLLQLANNE